MSRYVTYTAVVAAGNRLPIHIGGNYVSCLAADDTLKVAFDGGAPGEIYQGVTVEVDLPFSEFEIVNDTAGPVSFTLGIGTGRVRDQRLTASAPLDVRDPGDNSSFADVVAAIVAAGALIEPENDWAGATLDQGSAAGTPVLVTAAANTNGVRVRFLSLVCGSAGHAQFRIGGAVAVANWSTHGVVVDKPFIVPAGLEISLSRTGADSYTMVVYEVL